MQLSRSPKSYENGAKVGHPLIVDGIDVRMVSLVSWMKRWGFWIKEQQIGVQ